MLVISRETEAVLQRLWQKLTNIAYHPNAGAIGIGDPLREVRTCTIYFEVSSRWTLQDLHSLSTAPKFPFSGTYPRK